MKVLIVSHLYPTPANPVYGIFIHKQVKELIRQGCQIKVVSPVPWSPWVLWFRKKWRRYSQVPKRTVIDNIEVFYPRVPFLPGALFLSLYGYLYYWSIKKLVYAIFQGFPFEVIHCHVALPTGFAGILLKRHFGKPLIVNIHGRDLLHTIYRSSRCRRAIETVFDGADAIVNVSSKLAAIASRYCAESSKVRVILDGVDPDDLGIEGKTFIKGKKGKLLLSVGNLVEIKGHDLTLRAFSRLLLAYPDLNLVIIGGGKKEEELKALASHLGLGEAVRFLGRRPYSEVMEWMSCCDIFVLPSWDEGLGIVYLEAMAHGKPAIGCQDQGIEDVIVHGKVGGLLVKPKNVDSLENALRILLSDEEYAGKLGESGRERVLKELTWEANAVKTIDLYREVIGKEWNNR